MFNSKQAGRGFFAESLPSAARAGPSLLPLQVRELSLGFPISCQPELPKNWLGISCRHLIQVGFIISLPNPIFRLQVPRRRAEVISLADWVWFLFFEEKGLFTAKPSKELSKAVLWRSLVKSCTFPAVQERGAQPWFCEQGNVLLITDGEGALPAETNLSGAACYRPSQRNLNPSGECAVCSYGNVLSILPKET